MKKKKVIKMKEYKEKSRKAVQTDEDQLPQITYEIRNITTNMKTEIYRIGELLVQAKKILEHGEFKKWIKANFEFSYQKAHNFMNVYRHCLGRPELVKTIKASLLYKITSPGFPEDLREHIFENGKKLKSIKGKKFREVCIKFKRGELDLKSPEIKKLFRQNKRNAVNKAYAREIDGQIAKLERLRESILLKTAKFQWPLHPETQEVDVEGDQLKHINELISEVVKAIKCLRPGHGDIKTTKLAA